MTVDSAGAFRSRLASFVRLHSLCDASSLSISTGSVASRCTKANSADVMRELKALHELLAETSQDAPFAEALLPTAQALVHPILTTHKEGGIRALTACALANVLRLSAPRAPYTPRQLRDIFAFFVRELRTLSDVDGPFYAHIFYLLESVATVRSAALIVDAGADAEAVAASLISTLFDTVNARHAPAVRQFMRETCEQIIDECAVVPESVIRDLLKRISRVQDGATFEVARDLALDVLRSCAEKLEPFVAAHIAAMLPTKEAFALANELFDAVPAACAAVFALIGGEWCASSDEGTRLLATESLGRALVGANGYVLARSHATLWSLWTTRHADRSAAVRCAWISDALGVFCTLRSKAAEVLVLFHALCRSADERTRIFFVQRVQRISSDALGYILATGTVFDGLRCIFVELALEDRRPRVKMAAADALLWLLKAAATTAKEREDGVQQASQLVALFDDCLGLLYAGDRSSKNFFEEFVENRVLCDAEICAKFGGDSYAFCLAMLPVASEKALRAFHSLVESKAAFYRYVAALLRLVARTQSSIEDLVAGGLHNLTKMLFVKCNSIAKAWDNFAEFCSFVEGFVVYCRLSPLQENGALMERLLLNVQPADAVQRNEVVACTLKDLGMLGFGHLAPFIEVLLARCTFTLLNRQFVSRLAAEKSDALSTLRAAIIQRFVELEERDGNSLCSALFDQHVNPGAPIAEVLPKIYRFAKTNSNAFKQPLSEVNAAKFADLSTGMQSFIQKAIDDEDAFEARHFKWAVGALCIVDSAASLRFFGAVCERLGSVQDYASHEARASFCFLCAFSYTHAAEIVARYNSIFAYINRAQNGSQNTQLVLPTLKIMKNVMLLVKGSKTSTSVAQEAAKFCRWQTQLLLQLAYETTHISDANAADRHTAAQFLSKVFVCGAKVLSACSPPAHRHMLTAELVLFFKVCQNAVFEVRECFVQRLGQLRNFALLHEGFLALLLLAVIDPATEIKVAAANAFQSALAYWIGACSSSTSSSIVTAKSAAFYPSADDALRLEAIIYANFIVMLSLHPDFQGDLSPHQKSQLFKIFLGAFCDQIKQAVGRNVALLHEVSEQAAELRFDAACEGRCLAASQNLQECARLGVQLFKRASQTVCPAAQAAVRSLLLGTGSGLRMASPSASLPSAKATIAVDVASALTAAVENHPAKKASKRKSACEFDAASQISVPIATNSSSSNIQPNENSQPNVCCVQIDEKCNAAPKRTRSSRSRAKISYTE